MSNWREIAAYTRKDTKRIGSAAREKARQVGEGMKIGAQVGSIAARIAGNVKEKRDLDDFASSYDLKYDKKTDKYYSSGEDSEKIQLTRSQIKTIYDNPELDFKESVYLDGKAKDRFKFKETQEKNTFLDKLTKGIGDLFSSTTDKFLDKAGDRETMDRANTYKLDNWSDLKGSGMTPTEYLDKVEGIQNKDKALASARTGMGRGSGASLWDQIGLGKISEVEQVPVVDYEWSDILSAEERKRYDEWNILSAKYGGQKGNIITYGSRFDPITGERIN